MVLEPLVPGVVGLALLHFVWQGCLAGGFLAGALALLRGRFPELRYLLCLTTMAAMLVTPLVTAGLILAGLSAPPPHAWRYLPLLGLGTSVAVVSSPLLPWITWLWIAGASALQLRMITSWLWIRHIQRTASVSIPEHWTTELRSLMARMRVSRAVRLAESHLVRVPCVVGWLRPVILLPLGVARKLPSGQLRGILAHELAHIRRHDFLVNLVQCTFESLLFFHPMTWWISHRLRTEREYCCDDIALSVTGDAMTYARALAHLDEIRSRPADLALSSTGGHLMRRITRIFEKDSPAHLPARRWLPPALVTLGLFVLAVAGGAGCLNERATTTEAVIGPAPAEASAPTDQEAMLASVTERIEACRASGKIDAEVADAILAQLAEGDVVFANGFCCGEEGMMAVIDCPEECVDRAAAGCDPAAAGCDPAAAGCDRAAAGCDPAAAGCDPAAAGCDPAAAGCDPANCVDLPAGSDPKCVVRVVRIEDAAGSS